ncbi:tRNA threonylcarbamoyladenosine dehydratase [Oscillospiraceae bacterium LCP25S3_E10]|nr:tRNA threonylcarbamoyladenosine dehydratase [Ruminococcus sp.]MDD6446809.1 tRNA threonylcarbamoyladenosine dehydratase [Ruminococcus sp.]MDY2856220.1 tRNA threonylcarbamoyladenosine dehydratase [Oscillospiraceae bacterium]
MDNYFSREELLIGKEAIEILKNSRVAVFGVGGVGGFVVEVLARCGVGTIDVIDNDVVDQSNINRQIIATVDTIGQEKVNVVEQRIKSINPNAVVNKHRCFFLPETAKDFDFTKFDYVVDTIDTVSGKIEIILQAKKAEVPVISCMGAGNKLDPMAFVVTDIYKTSVCPLARVMRQKLKKLGVQDLKVVYSTEKAMKPNYPPDMPPQRKVAPGSVAFVPSVAGIIAGSEVIKDLIGYSNN